MAEMYSTIVAALFSLMDRSLVAYDACKPAAVSSIFLSNNDEMFAAVVVDEDNNNW
jgi:hypothetical protein